MLTSHTVYPNSGYAFQSSRWCLMHRPEHAMKHPIDNDGMFWWPLICAKSYGCVDVEFCG